MESIKGFARRATQSAKEKFASADSTTDERIFDTSKKIQQFQKVSVKISDKVTRLGRLFDELGQVLTDISADYKTISPVPGSEMDRLSDEMRAMGGEVSEKSKEFHKVLKENAFDPITVFLKELPKMKAAEEEQKRVQLEFDFFRNKVADLKRSHQKDPTRLPRNEQILEKWRKDLHEATEKTKAVASELYISGLKTIDLAVFTVSQCVGNYSTYTTALSKQHFLGAALPIYPTAPILAPMPLPPSPFQATPPPVAQSQPSGPQPSQLNYGYESHQNQNQGYPGQQPPYSQQQGGWNNQTSQGHQQPWDQSQQQYQPQSQGYQPSHSPNNNQSPDPYRNSPQQFQQQQHAPSQGPQYQPQQQQQPQYQQQQPPPQQQYQQQQPQQQPPQQQPQQPAQPQPIQPQPQYQPPPVQSTQAQPQSAPPQGSPPPLSAQFENSMPSNRPATPPSTSS